jgi:uncharacterized membrane protein
LWLSITLTAVLIFAFLLGYVLEARLERLAVQGQQNKDLKLSDNYRTLFIRVMPVGSGATLVIIAVIYLMVTKSA